MAELIYLVPLFPLLGFIFLGLFGKKIKSEALIGAIGSSMVGLSFLVTCGILFSMISSPVEQRSTIVRLFSWIQTGNFSVDIAYQVDQLSILFTMIITGVGTLIHIYSIGYMHGDRSFYRFFCYLNLFIFMMLNLVLANNLLLTFLGWEGVGLASFLLIGFWYDRKFDGVSIIWTGDAAKKAFIVNRIGDFGVLLAMFLLFTTIGTLDYTQINAQASTLTPMMVTAIALLLFLGCTGKSAQIPLGVWLPDAMAGPTPVSALIHAATMVTSGIFLIARTSNLFAHSTTAMAVVTGIGITTALIAGTVGLVQNDIKKVLAYSTVSQLGFMFAALGVGGFTPGVFHVMTHAFFKALLFLGAGSVIHGMHEEQDIKKMGGLKKYMPKTYLTFLIGTIAISGIPPFAGFFSKDEILWYAWDKGSPVLWGVGVVAAFCTAFYMFRLFHLTFNGKERFDHHHVHPHESPATMTIPLMILAVASVLGGLLGVPYVLGFFISDHPNILDNWLSPIFASANETLHYHAHHEIHAIEYILMAISTGVALTAILLATKLYKNYSKEATSDDSRNFLWKLLWNKYYVDELYQIKVRSTYVVSNSILWKIVDVLIIDGIVNSTARIVGVFAEIIRRIQTGFVQNYAIMMLLGILAIIGWLVIRY